MTDIELYWAALPAEHDTMTDFIVDAIGLEYALAKSDPDHEPEHIRAIREAFSKRKDDWLCQPGSPLDALAKLADTLGSCGAKDEVMLRRYIRAVQGAAQMSCELYDLMFDADAVPGCEPARDEAARLLGIRWS